LLEPTRIYVPQVLPAVHANLIKGMAHITGGGFIENIPRALPKGMGCFVDVSKWDLPPVFRYLMKTGGIEPLEMAKTFNNGIGMVVIVHPSNVQKAISVLREAGTGEVYEIGEVTAQSGVQLRNIQLWQDKPRA
jgi:phosphoribosylamine--glycine ligase / phosphoribosylformylglycinamidine cyclo-ligase